MYKPTGKFFAIEKPELLKEWDYERNKQDPTKLALYSNQKVWWRCKYKPEHRWECLIYTRTRPKSTGCPYCFSEPPFIEDSLLGKFPEIAKTWHPTKNGDLTPDKVRWGSDRKAWWFCSKNKDHDWEQPITRRTRYGCPYCSGYKVNFTNCLATKRPDLIDEWHPTKNTISPYEITENSLKTVWWICKNGHEWDTRVSSRRKNNCPFCSNHRVNSENCLAVTRPDIASQWCYERNGEFKPTDVVAGSAKVFFWVCPKNYKHIWKARVCTRTGPTPNHCPFCVYSKGEEAIVECLDKIDIKYEREYTFPDCKNKSLLWFDFAIFDKNDRISFLIEYNGAQHYKPVSFFGGEKHLKALQENDEVKKKYCLDNGIDLLIIPYTEYKKINNILIDKIENLLE